MSDVEPCNCPIKLKPLVEWLKDDDDGTCRPCMVAPVTQWYREELEENKKTDLVKRIDDTVYKQKAEPLQICELLDTIKGEVEDSLRERLKDFDCAAQTFNQNDVTE